MTTCLTSAKVYLGLTGNPPPFTLGTSGTSLLGGTHVLTGSGTANGRFNWTDVSQHVESVVSVSKGGGSDSLHFRAGPGRCSFTLSNRDGQYDPLNTGGPHYGKLRAGLPIKVTATPDGGAETIMFIGRADDWPVEYWNDQWSEVRISASDDVETLNSANPGKLDLDIPVQTTTDRCKEILNRGGWPDALVSVESHAWMNWEQQRTDLGQTTWAELQLAADSGDAWLYLDPDNVVKVIKNTIPTTPVATFGNASTPAAIIPLVDLEADRNPRARLVNKLTVRTPYVEPPSAWTFDDVLSQSQDGERAWERSDLMTWPALGLYFYGDVLAQRWNDVPQWQPSKLTVRPETATHATTCIAAKVGTLVEVKQVTPDARTITARGYVCGTRWLFPPVGRPTVELSLYPERRPTA